MLKHGQAGETVLKINGQTFIVGEFKDEDYGTTMYNVRSPKEGLIYEGDNLLDWLSDFSVGYHLELSDKEIKEIPQHYSDGTFVKIDVNIFGVIVGAEFTHDQPCYCIQEIKNANDEAEIRWLYGDEFEVIDFDNMMKLCQ